VKFLENEKGGGRDGLKHFSLSILKGGGLLSIFLNSFFLEIRQNVERLLAKQGQKLFFKNW